jgi:hypothetical protein
VNGRSCHGVPGYAPVNTAPRGSQGMHQNPTVQSPDALREP